MLALPCSYVQGICKRKGSTGRARRTGRAGQLVSVHPDVRVSVLQRLNTACLRKHLHAVPVQVQKMVDTVPQRVRQVRRFRSHFQQRTELARRDCIEQHVG